MKSFVLLLASACVLTPPALAGVTTHLKVDCRTGVRDVSPEAEILHYDVNWYEDGDVVRLTDNDVVLTNGTFGSYVWYPAPCSTAQHVLKLEVLSGGKIVEMETAQFDSIAPTEAHTAVVTQSAVAPTSSTVGHTAETCCSRCGELIQAATEVPALGYIRNVTARQLWPHKKIEVCYTVADDIGEVAKEDDDCVLLCNMRSDVIGDTSWTPGRHCVVLDLEKDGTVLFDGMTVTVSCGIPSDMNLVHRWSFNGNLTDSVGGQDAVAYGSVTAGAEFYTLPGGYRGAGYIDLGTNIISDVNSPFTIELWATLITQQTWGRIFEIGLDDANYFELSWNRDAGTQGAAELYQGGANIYNTTEVMGLVKTGVPYHIATTFEPNADNTGKTRITWSRRDAQTGAVLASKSAVMPDGWFEFDFHRATMFLGHSQHRSTVDANASYDEVRIWKRMMSEVELTASVQAGPDVCYDRVLANSVKLKLGSNDDGPGYDLTYSPIDTGLCEVQVDGVTIFSATNSGVFTWQPLTKGVHTLKHIAGTNVWTRTVNVTSLVYEEPTPNPPMAEDANFTISTTVRALTSTAKTSGTIGTAKVDSSYSGTWSATTSVDWITLTYATRNVGLPVIYTVAENKGVEARTGYVYVSGHVFTITQPGVGAELDHYLDEFDQNGGEGTVTVLAESQSGWRARSNVDWISVETLCGTGECEVIYHVAPWAEVSTRNDGTITIAGQTFTVYQTGRPMKLSAESVEKDYLAHDIVLTVDALSSTAWGIALDASWLSIVERGSGKGAGSVTLAINENPSYSNRTATALIGTETFTVVQTGRPTAALAFAISPEATMASVKGANGVIAVEATPDLPWTATSQASWLTVMPGFSAGAGNGNVVYAATPNPIMAERSGTIRVSPEAASGVPAKTHSVTQPAATAMLSVDNHTFAVDGDSFAVEVSVDDVVAWTIVENVDWLSVDGATSRNGPGTVTISVEPNMSIESREATITIAGHEFRVTQRGRTISLEYGETVFPPDAFEEATIEVHPNGEVEWTAVPSDATWISVWSEDENCTYNADGSVSGIGDATLKYMVTAYVGDGELASGWIQIGNERVYVYQRAYELSIDPCATNVTGNAGAGAVAVPATAGQVWNAIATEDWITLANTNGMGSGTVNYTLTDNDTGETRTGKIVIAGEEYTITQAARQLVQIDVEVDGSGEVRIEGEVKVKGQGQQWSGSFDRGTTVGLTAVASNGWRFVRWKKGGSAISTASSITVTADVDQAIVAVFEKIPVYTVNGESVVEGTIKSFVAPETIVMGGTTQLVCLGSSAFPAKGTSFQIQVTGNIDFDWDLWQTNYWVAIEQSEGGTISGAVGVRALPGWAAAGDEVAFAATPAAGKSLCRWVGLDGVASNDSSITTRVSHPLTVSAIFGIFEDTLATAADAPTQTFRTGGSAEWTPVIDPTAETGLSSVRSGTIGAESETWLETTVVGGGTCSFSWKVDCEHDDGGMATWDRLSVFTNGVEATRIDGRSGWQRVELPLTAPQTILRWSFFRDDYDEWGEGTVSLENAAWIDGLEVR